MEAFFTKILEGNKNVIYRICATYSDGEEDAKDLFQDVLINMWKSLPGFRNESSLKTWVYRIALNVCLRAKAQTDKRKKMYVDFKSVKVEQIANPDSADAKKYSELYHCIRKLNDADKSIILLFLEELSYKEIAEVTGLTENHIAVKIKRIKNKLLTCLKKKTDV